MNAPPEQSCFWCTKVRPGKPCTIEIPQECDAVIANAALATLSEEIEPFREYLRIKINSGKSFAVTPLISGVLESVPLTIYLVAGDKVILEVEGGDLPVAVCGYTTDYCQPIIDNGEEPEQSPNPQYEEEAILDE